MKTSSAKQKGRLLQQWLCKELLKRFPSLEAGDITNTSMGCQGEDVKLSPAARKLIPMQFECKSLAKVAVYQHMEQAKTHGLFDPVVIIKQNHSKPLAVLDAELFFDLLKKAYNGN